MAGSPEESEKPRPRRRRRSPRKASVDGEGQPVAETREAVGPAQSAPSGAADTKAPPRRRRRSGPRRPAEDDAPSAPVALGNADEATLGDREPTERAVSEDSQQSEDRNGTILVTVAIPRGWARRINARLTRSVVLRALELDRWQGPATLDVLFVRDQEIRDINATHRGIDEETDVLSFPLLDLKPGTGLTEDFFVLPPDASPHLGDVVISVDRVEAQAKEAGHSEQRELAYLTVHGVLHILGYDHESPAERREMRTREEEVLDGLGLRRAEVDE